MATVERVQHRNSSEQRFLLQNVGWKVYDLLLRELGDRAVRLTYSRGDLELMTPSDIHEQYKTLLGRLIEAMTLELRIPIRSGGSTTFRREELDRGLEPDECYYIANEPIVRGKRNLNLELFPPPDLAIEIDITSSSIDRQEIYARIGVPELWRFDGEALQILVLDSSRQYNSSKRSPSFPFLPHEQLVPFLDPDPHIDETTHVANFIDWVRTVVAPQFHKT